MWQRNNGIGESNILQNQFTAYLLTSVRRRKLQYLRSKMKLQEYEISIEVQDYLNEFAAPIEQSASWPLLDQLENIKLRQALEQAKERELYIFFAKALDERSLAEIARELDIGYNTVAAVYYRLIKKIKKHLGGDEQ